MHSVSLFDPRVRWPRLFRFRARTLFRRALSLARLYAHPRIGTEGDVSTQANANPRIDTEDDVSTQVKALGKAVKKTLVGCGGAEALQRMGGAQSDPHYRLLRKLVGRQLRLLEVGTAKR